MTLVKEGRRSDGAIVSRRQSVPRTPAHAAFGARLRRSMERRELTRAALADIMGVTPTMVGYWRSGRYLPTPELALLLSETLDDGKLREMVVTARTMRCGNCGKTFDREQTRATYCSAACQRRAHLPGGKVYDPRQEAIDAMCRACEPEGTCRDDACALRPYSPFLFIPVRRKAA